MTGQGSKATRFRKGQSGNPKGRPKKVKSAEPSESAFDIIVDRTLQVVKGGRLVNVDLEEALQHKTYRDAVAGCRTSRRLVMKMIEKREAAMAGKASKKVPTVEVRPVYDPTNADAALELLGITSRDRENSRPGLEGYAPIKIETWAVNAALSRRKGGMKLTEGEIARITSDAVEPGAIRWPRGSAG